MSGSKYIRVVAPILICLLGLVLRLLFLGRQSLWFDEGFSIWMSGHSIHLMMTILRDADAHPPLFYAFLHYWMMGGHSELFLRLPSVFFGTLDCALIYLLAKAVFDDSASAILALVWACSFAAMNEETQVRMYAMAVTFSLAAAYFFLRAYRKPSTARWGAYVFLASLSLYTHYYTGFLLLAQATVLFLGKRYKEGVWVYLTILAVFFPWVPALAHQFAAGLSTGFPRSGWGDLLRDFAYLLVTRRFLYGAPLSIVSLAGIGLAGWGFASLLKQKRNEALFLIPLFLIPCLIPFGIGRYTRWHIFAYRYTILFAPYFFFLVAAGIFHLPKPLAYTLLSAFFVINLVNWILFLSGGAFQRQNWRGAAAVIGPRLAAGDTLFVEQGMSLFPLSYYLPARLSIRWAGGGFDARDPSKKTGIRWVAINAPPSSPFIEAAAKRSRREWLILCQPGIVDPRHAILSWMRENRRNVFSYVFPAYDPADAIYVVLFVPRACRPAGGLQERGRPEVFSESLGPYAAAQNDPDRLIPNRKE